MKTKQKQLYSTIDLQKNNNNNKYIQTTIYIIEENILFIQICVYKYIYTYTYTHTYTHIYIYRYIYI